MYMSNEQAAILYDETNATIYGFIASDNERDLGYVQGAFHDFGAYIAELSAIHEQFRQENGGKAARPARYSLQEEKQDGREIRRETAEAFQRRMVRENETVDERKSAHSRKNRKTAGWCYSSLIFDTFWPFGGRRRHVLTSMKP